MAQPTYPNAQDLIDLLENTTFPKQWVARYPWAIDSAISEWESNVGWYPYLSSGQSEVRLFDPPGTGNGYGRSSSLGGGRVLDLAGGVLSISSLSIGFINTVGQTKIGSVLTQGTQYYLKPNNALARGLVPSSIEFMMPVRGLPQSIRIVGVWGRVASVPDDVWLAILYKAVSALALNANLSLGGIASIKTEATTTQFVDINERIRNADAVFNQQLKDSKRLVV